jgi:hypothetical protein
MIQENQRRIENNAEYVSEGFMKTPRDESTVQGTVGDMTKFLSIIFLELMVG